MSIFCSLPLVAALVLLPAAFGESIEFKAAPQQQIEDRLRAYSRKNADREPALRTLFQDAACLGDDLLEQPVKGSKSPNLICSRKGESESTIVVGAHYDLVEKGAGVVDNWSGAALLPSLAQGLSGTPRKHTFVFVGFTAEEVGLVGSKAYVKQLGEARNRVKAMVNMDTLGLADTEVWASHADPQLVKYLAAVAASMKLPWSGMNVEQVGSTDSEPFREKKIPAITIHSLTQATLRLLHSPDDKIEAIHMDEYYRTYKLVLGFLAFLDQKLD